MQCLAGCVQFCCGEGGSTSSRRKQNGHCTVEDKQERDFVAQAALADKMFKTMGLDRNAQKPAVTHIEQETVLEAGATAHSACPLHLPMDMEQAKRYHRFLEEHAGSNPISSALAKDLLSEFTMRYYSLHNNPLTKVHVPRNGKVHVVGDTHGQLHDVLLFLKKLGPPSKDNVYLINGDICDRGNNACEIWFLWICYFLADPNSVIINRGNHESEYMNALHKHEGGGFQDEVRAKFDNSVYHTFIHMFKHLNLGAIIEDKIAVFHGGISHRSDFTYDAVQQIPHTTATMPAAEQVAQDFNWNCILWSDPADGEGAFASDRGCGIEFGPDITKAFLSKWGNIKTLVRSHQLPPDDKGYELHHLKRCVTIFSASNYGESGNDGAVMTFDSKSFPSYTFLEYYAPPLDQISSMIIKGKDDFASWLAAGKSLQAGDSSGKDRIEWEKEVRAIMVMIVESKLEIYDEFLQTTKGATMVNFNTWSDIMSRVCGKSWRWDRAWSHFGYDQGSGKVNFIDFMRRFTAVFSNEDFASFKLKAIRKVFDELLDKDDHIDQKIHSFDKDGDGTVTQTEMKAALRAMKVSLSPSQIDAITRMVFHQVQDAGKEIPSLDVMEFMGRLAVMFEHNQALTMGSAAKEQDRLSHELQMKVAEIVHNTPLETFGGKTVKDKDGLTDIGKEATKLVTLFRLLDADNNGVITMDEFKNFFKKLPQAQVKSIKLSNNKEVSDKMVEELLYSVDKAKTGKLNIFEWLNLLLGEGERHNTSADTLADNMISVLLRNRSAFRAACLACDPNGTGKVPLAQCEIILKALNKAVEQSGHSWSPAQISDLVEAFALDGKTIEYNVLFESLCVIDSTKQRTMSYTETMGHRPSVTGAVHLHHQGH